MDDGASSPQVRARREVDSARRGRSKQPVSSTLENPCCVRRYSPHLAGLRANQSATRRSLPQSTPSRHAGGPRLAPVTHRTRTPSRHALSSSPSLTRTPEPSDDRQLGAVEEQGRLSRCRAVANSLVFPKLLSVAVPDPYHFAFNAANTL